ncbi:MAG: hypothetical protein PF482_12335 [Desulfobacteraceae bacterium]|jgi:hypothetical protein|nr:hypothetical protein [Desulfobacteraceae bacterium]
MKISCFKLTNIVCCFIFFAIVAGCSTFNSLRSCRINIDYAQDMDSKMIWPDTHLQNTFCKYWSLRYDGNIKKTYDMEAPQFQNQVTFEQYGHYVKRTSDNVLNKLLINGSGKEGENTTYFECNFYMKTSSGKDISGYIKDKWIQVDGEWVHALKDPLFFPIDYE